MRPAKILGLVFLVLAVNAIALTTSASAVLLTNFLPTPTEKAPVTFTDKGGKGELVPLGEKLGGFEVIKCNKSTSKGELTTPNLGKGEIKFEECSSGGGLVTCESLDKTIKNGIVSKGTVHIQTGVTKGGKEVPALVILPENVHFSCGPELLLILQSAEDPSCSAGQILEENVLLKTLKVEFKEESGDPGIPEVWNDTDTTLYKCKVFFNKNEGSLLDSAIGTEKEVEVSGFKQSGKEITALIDF
jgi:hypothetical protein